jgi:signal transduction histidine kinase
MSTPITRSQQLQGVLVGTVLIGNDGGIDGTGPAGLDYFGALEPLNTSTQSATVTQATDNGTLQIHTAGGSFENNLTGQATVESTGWTVTVERDRTALVNRLQIFQYIQFGSLLVVLLSVFGLGFYQYRTNLRQTERLLDGFDALTGGDFDHRLGFSGAREWEQISDGFNAMAGGLADREQTIRERERQIREREQRLSVLNRVLRHNMQNDMNVIQGYAEIIAESDSPEQQKQAAETISETASGLVDHSRKARHLETVIENAEAGRSRIGIVSEVERIVDDCAREHPDCTVETALPDNAYVWAVAGVEFGIESLVENAFEYADGEEPEVRVTVQRDGDQTRIEVRDNGPGIPDHEREVLLQDEETSLEHGSGIGLWLAYWATVKSDGQLQFGDQTDGGAVTVSLSSADRPDRAGDESDRAGDREDDPAGAQTAHFDS